MTMRIRAARAGRILGWGARGGETSPRLRTEEEMNKVFLKDDRGSITFFVLVLSIGLLAMMGLVMDTGRSYSAHTQTQAFVDNVALAMAEELDGQPGAITRAKAIMDTSGALAKKAVQKSSLLTGTKIDGEYQDFEVFEPIFLSGEPPVSGSGVQQSDIASLIVDPNAADADLRATHVLIVGKPQEVPWTFLNVTSIVTNMDPNEGSVTPTAASDSFTVQSWAAAEYVRGEARTNELLMICGCDELYDMDAGQQMRLTKSRDGDWSTCGTYGVVSTINDDAAGTCSNLSGADEIACKLAIDAPLKQNSDMTVSAMSDETVAGVDSLSVHAGLNTRFNIFDDMVAGLADNAAVSPDTNTIAGELYTCEGVLYDDRTDSAPLPHDPCLADGSCDFLTPKVTSDQLADYCEINFGDDCSSFDEGISTRYMQYLAEIGNDMLDPRGAEAPRSCTSTEAAANRRVIEVAVVDCSNISETEKLNPTNIPVEAYAEVFLTNPVNTSEYYVAGFDSYTRSDGTEVEMENGDVVSTDAKFSGSYDTMDPYAELGLTIDVIKGTGKADHINAPMLFDSSQENEDPDLVHTGRGNLLIISEDGDPETPDDEGGGGTLVFNFDEPTYVHSILVFDTEGGGDIRVWKDDPATAGVTERPDLAALPNLEHNNRKMSEFEIHDATDPELSNDDRDELAGADWAKSVKRMGHIDNNYVRVIIDQHDVTTMTYTMINDSGAIDDLVFWNSKTEFTRRDEIMAEFLDYIEPQDSRIITYSQLSN